MFRRSLKLAAVLAAVLTFGACADSPTGPTTTPQLDVEGSPTSLCQGTQGAHDC